MASGQYYRTKIGSHGAERNPIDKSKSLLVEDLESVRNSVNIGDTLNLITDVWTVTTQLRVDVKAYVIAKYKHFCIVEFYWHNQRGAIALTRCVKYVDILLERKRATRIVVDMRNRWLDREVIYEG